MEMEGSSRWKILFFGGTGYIGKYMVRAGVELGHPTFVYVRPQSLHSIPPAKLDLRDEFRAIGVTILEGELEEHEKMVSAMKEVDVVISALPYPLVPAQLKIIEAIKAAGNIKRFIPSDFGVEEDRTTALPPFQAFLDKKKQIRRETEAAGIPYTYIAPNLLSAHFINHLLHPSEQRNDVLVYGTGGAKVVLNYEEDVAKYTIKVSCDPRACNRVVIFRLPKNIISQNELISLWEKKRGRTPERVHVPEEEIMKLSQTLPDPENIPVSIIHSVFVKGDVMRYELKEDDLEVSRLYPDADYTSVDQVLDIFLAGRAPPITFPVFASQ